MNGTKIEYRSMKKNQGKFRFYTALKTDEKGFIKTFKDPNTGQILLKGVATNTQVDKEFEHPTADFIEKNKDRVLGLNVFADHDHKIEDTVGFVSEVGGEAGELEVTSNLEDPENNSKVKMVLDKINHGTKIAYSIGGRITKASEYYDKELDRNILQFDEGVINEITLTPYPAAYGTDVSQVGKTLRKSLETMDKVSIKDEQENFWGNYEKAINKYERLSKTQPKWDEVDKNELPRSCFANQGLKKNRRTWEYPFKWINKDGEEEIHIQALDNAWIEANLDEEKPLSAIKILKSARKELNLDSKALYFVDNIDKVIGESLAVAIEERIDNDKLYTIYSTYSDKAWEIVWSEELEITEKIDELTNLTDELVSVLDNDFYGVKATAIKKLTDLSLTINEVLIMGTKKDVTKTNVEELDDVLTDEIRENITNTVKDIITKALNPDEKKEKDDEKASKEDKEDSKETEKNLDTSKEKSDRTEDKEKVSDSKDAKTEQNEIEKMFKNLLTEVKEIVSQAVNEKDDKSDKEKSADSKTDEDELNKISEDVVAEQIKKFFSENDDLKLVGRKQSVLKTLEKENGIDVSEILNDEEKFASLDDDVKKSLIGNYFSGKLGNK